MFRYELFVGQFYRHAFRRLDFFRNGNCEPFHSSPFGQRREAFGLQHFIDGVERNGISLGIKKDLDVRDGIIPLTQCDNKLYRLVACGTLFGTGLFFREKRIDSLFEILQKKMAEFFEIGWRQSVFFGRFSRTKSVAIKSFQSFVISMVWQKRLFEIINWIHNKKVTKIS